MACGAPVRYQPEEDKLSADDRQKLAKTAEQYIGAPYKYGGLSAKGFDCSGLVYYIYKEALGWKLPRNTDDLYDCSYMIDYRHARAGDFTFFKIGSGKINHIGMMINEYQFIHASKSSGVIVSDFGSEYYRNYFTGIRRLR